MNTTQQVKVETTYPIGKNGETLEAQSKITFGDMVMTFRGEYTQEEATQEVIKILMS